MVIASDAEPEDVLGTDPPSYATQNSLVPGVAYFVFPNRVYNPFSSDFYGRVSGVSEEFDKSSVYVEFSHKLKGVSTSWEKCRNPAKYDRLALPYRGRLAYRKYNLQVVVRLQALLTQLCRYHNIPLTMPNPWGTLTHAELENSSGILHFGNIYYHRADITPNFPAELSGIDGNWKWP